MWGPIPWVVRTDRSFKFDSPPEGVQQVSGFIPVTDGSPCHILEQQVTYLCVASSGPGGQDTGCLVIVIIIVISWKGLSEYTFLWQCYYPRFWKNWRLSRLISQKLPPSEMLLRQPCSHTFNPLSEHLNLHTWVLSGVQPPKGSF